MQPKCFIADELSYHFPVGAADLLERGDWCSWFDELSPGLDAGVENKYPPQSWWPHRECLVLTPASRSDALSTETHRNLLLSAISVATANMHCSLPVWLYAGSESNQRG